MSLYNYRAKSPKGDYVEGIVEGSTDESAVSILRDKDLTIISLVVRKEGILEGSGGGGFKFFGGVKMKDLVVFSRQLSVMMAASVPIVQALHILMEQTQNKPLKKIVVQMADDVDGGMKLSEALTRHPGTFSDFFISMVKAGEASGKLDETLNYLADQSERDYELASKIKGAMMYPAFIVCAMIVVGFIMMIFVVPQLTQMLVESGAELPLMTRALIATSKILQGYWWLVALAAAGAFAALRSLINTPNGRLLFDELKVKTPIFGKLFATIYLVRFTRSLSTLMGGGVPLAQAMEIVANVIGNAVWKKMLIDTTTAVREGNTIASQVMNNPNFPQSVAHMVAIGEQTGRLEEILKTLTSFYSKEINTLVDGLISLIEPVIMVVMGVAVGGMVAAILMPMFSLINAQGG
ncbi:type II secretion system F family protein [Candidatus Uhrbacteria bacterium]|nr:type II secretion system F family protein [Candidatus Uhrbacteria bacterium]